MRSRLLWLCAVTVLLSGCTDVQFYEKEYLNSPLMRFEEFGTVSHFEQKVFYSREGSIGGIGTSAGGGCGCY